MDSQHRPNDDQPDEPEQKAVNTTHRVGYQGEPGAYSELAALQAFPRARHIGFPTFFSVFDALEGGVVDAAMLPMENSTEGAVTWVHDLVISSGALAFLEVFLPVRHCLIAREDAELADIKAVFSHPQALEQCRGLFRDIEAKPIPHDDTSGAVRAVKESGRADIGALASARAAHLHHMKIIKIDVQDRIHNTTRFLAFSLAPSAPHSEDQVYKTSIVLSVDHKPGTLARVLQLFANTGINLTKLESRPTKINPWEYYFFIDFEGHREDLHVANALAEIQRVSRIIKIIGSYPLGQILDGSLVTLEK